MRTTTISVLFLCIFSHLSTYHIQKETYWLCFDIFVTSPEAMNATLLCSDGYMEIIDIQYVRPLQVGDSVCTNRTYNYLECCQTWRADHVQCIVQQDWSMLKENCEHQSECSISLEPLNMYAECEASCSDNSTDPVCWSRGVQITYVCYSIDLDITTPGTATEDTDPDSTVPASTTSDTTVPENRSLIQNNCECSAELNRSSILQKPELITIEWLTILAAVSSVCFAIGVTIGWSCTRLHLYCEKHRGMDKNLTETQEVFVVEEVNTSKDIEVGEEKQHCNTVENDENGTVTTLDDTSILHEGRDTQEYNFEGENNGTEMSTEDSSQDAIVTGSLTEATANTHNVCS